MKPAAGTGCAFGGGVAPGWRKLMGATVVYDINYLIFLILTLSIMETNHHHHHLMSEGLHIGFAIAKLALKVATVAALCLTVKEIHKVHKSLEARHK